MTRCSPGNSFNLCCGLTLTVPELEDNEHRRFPPLLRFLRTSRFLFCVATLGAFNTSKIDNGSSSHSDSESEVIKEVES